MPLPSPSSFVCLEVISRADCVGTGLLVKQRALLLGWNGFEAAELCLIVVELAINSVRHGRGGECFVALDHQRLVLVVLDEGPGFSPEVLSDHGRTDGMNRSGPVPPGKRAPGRLGSGLASTRRLADELVLENRLPRGARIVARRELRSP